MLTERLAFALGLNRAHAELKRRMDARLGGIGYTDFLLLTELSNVQGGRLRAVDLANRLLVTPSGVTRAVLPLEKIGLVARERHERDARATHIVLTPIGRKVVESATEQAERIVEDAFDFALTANTRLALLGFFERLGYGAPVTGGSRNESKPLA
ncbi:MAG: MarR family transcriptional regulator [Candidatus Eremiobacteraeota bacterium]|nr:MarR family transcriptional regulator [Candidatus Eremiobacteraeota bacterium]